MGPGVMGPNNLFVCPSSFAAVAWGMIPSGPYASVANESSTSIPSLASTKSSSSPNRAFVVASTVDGANPLPLFVAEASALPELLAAA
eukprot:12244136-Alexandrium_andersonii.AAC.1